MSRFEVFNKVQFDTEELGVSDVETSVLRDLWVARFGDDWVPLPTKPEDIFYSVAALRFIRDQQIEHRYLMSEGRTVVRLTRTEDNNAGS